MTPNWITTAYYERAQSALFHPRLTIAAGFTDGKNEYEEVGLGDKHPTAHALVLSVLAHPR